MRFVDGRSAVSRAMRLSRLVLPLTMSCASALGFPEMSGAGDSGSPVERTSISQYGLQHWDRESGLAGNWVRDIARGADGAIWIATAGGLSRFDGWSFTDWPTTRSGDLSIGSINALAGSAERIWIGFDRGGVGVLRDGEIAMPARFGSYPSELEVNDLLEDESGTVWIGSAGGLWRSVGDDLRLYDEAIELREANVRRVLSPDGDELWIRTADHGVWRVGPERALRLPDIPGCYGADLAIGPNGTVFTSCSAGLWRLPPGASAWELLTSERVVSLFVDREGALWFGRRAGLVRRIDGEEELLPADRYLGDWRARAWLEDEDGLWVGTFSAGLARLRRGPIRAVGAAEGLPIRETTAVLARPDGTLLIGGYRGGLVHWSLRDGLLRHWTTADGLPADAIWALAQDPVRVERVWVGTGAGLAWVEDGEIGTHGPLQIPYGDDTRLVYPDPVALGTIWVAGYTGGLVEVLRAERRSSRSTKRTRSRTCPGIAPEPGGTASGRWRRRALSPQWGRLGTGARRAGGTLTDGTYRGGGRDTLDRQRFIGSVSARGVAGLRRLRAPRRSGLRSRAQHRAGCPGRALDLGERRPCPLSDQRARSLEERSARQRPAGAVHA